MAAPGFVRWAMLLCLVQAIGCSRPFWRTQADFDTYNLLMEKTADQRWDLPRVALDADPRSRIYDPFDPDLEPLPPDDITANAYMHWVDGMQGYKSWHKFGVAMSVENPQWLNQFEFAPEDFDVEWLNSNREGETTCPPAIVPTIRNLTLEQAVELANINSREYQLQLENTFLSALALSFSRFRFNVRYLGLNGLEPTSDLTYLNQPSNLSTLSFNNRFGISQLLPTGAQWVVEMANNTLWIFSAPSDTNSASVLSYSIVQPLLQGAGRKIVLEDLTLNERNVLYNIRTLARFRKIFFAETVINDGASGGFLGILRQIQQVENQRFNLRELKLAIDKLRAANSDPNRESREFLQQLPPGFTIPERLAERLQHDPDTQALVWQGEMLPSDETELRNLTQDPQLQQAINSLIAQHRLQIITLDLAQLLNRQATSLNQLRTAEANLLQNVDDFKLQLGLPTDFQLTVDRSMLKPFELIDPQLSIIEDRLMEIILAWGELADGEMTQNRLRSMVKELETVREQLGELGVEVTRRDLEREAENRNDRLKRLKTDADRTQTIRNIERDRLQFKSVVDERTSIGIVLSDLDRYLANHEIPSDGPPQDASKEDFPVLLEYLRSEELPPRSELPGMLRNLREDLLQLAQRLKVIQAGVRSDLIKLPEFHMCLEDATHIALENRLDLMNERGRVMDARRAMEVSANRTQGVMNLVTRGDIRNSGGVNPFDFRSDRSTFQVGVQFTAPLDMVLERNDYRATQIDYQRARRTYMELEDTVKLQVREEWRQLHLLAENFETSRQNLRIAAIQLDLAVENSSLSTSSAQSAIPNPGQAAQRGTGSGNQGLNLLNALQTILNAQNDLINIWVEYERNRINIHRDMDIMVVDERGLWVDAAYTSTVSPASNSEPAHVLPPERIDRSGGDVTGPSDQTSPQNETTIAPVALVDADRPDRGDRGLRDDAGTSRVADEPRQRVLETDGWRLRSSRD